MSLPTTSTRDAKETLWRKGLLARWKLHPGQLDLYNTFQDAKEKIIVWCCSRRFGKSRTALVIAIETCLRNPNFIVKYVAPQQKMVRTILKQEMRKITDDCPRDIMPKFFTQDNTWRFPNGSEIQMAGVDSGNHESLRGGNAHFCVVDEAGFCDDLKYTVGSVLLPTMLTTGGKMVLVSSAPLSKDHDFVTFMDTAKINKCFQKKIVDDIPFEFFPADERQTTFNASGGITSPTVRREYYCEIITDESRAIVPEFREVKDEIIKVWERPPFYDPYTSMDVGHKDLTAVLFSYFDFRNGKLIIEDEYCINGPQMTTDVLARDIKAKEVKLWQNAYGTGSIKPYLRVSDNNLILINDLHRMHSLSFIPTAKDNADAALNQMRMLIRAGKIIINPRCVNLLNHLENGTWNKARTSYERVIDDLGKQHHYDTIDALVYLIRNVNWNRNPYPIDYDFPKGDLYLNPDAGVEALNPFERHVKSIFSVKSSIKKRN